MKVWVVLELHWRDINIVEVYSSEQLAKDEVDRLIKIHAVGPDLGCGWSFYYEEWDVK